MPKTDQVKNIFALILGEMYPVSLYLHDFPDAFLYISAGSWSDHRHVLGGVRFFTECFQGLLDFAAKVGESAGLLNEESG